jgi:hypothetical protein
MVRAVNILLTLGQGVNELTFRLNYRIFLKLLVYSRVLFSQSGAGMNHQTKFDLYFCANPVRTGSPHRKSL